MTIQQMFDLLREYRDSADRVNNHPDTTLTPDLRACITEEYHLSLKVTEYLPKFTPMHCRHCRYYTRECVSKNRPAGVDFCSLYEVIDNEKKE